MLEQLLRVGVGAVLGGDERCLDGERTRTSLGEVLPATSETLAPAVTGIALEEVKHGHDPLDAIKLGDMAKLVRGQRSGREAQRKCHGATDDPRQMLVGEPTVQAVALAGGIDELDH